MCAWSQLGLRDKADAPRKVGTAITTKQAKAAGGNASLSAPILRQSSHLSGSHCDQYMHTCRNCRVRVCVLARALKNGSIITKSHVRPQLSRSAHKLINFSPTYFTLFWFIVFFVTFYLFIYFKIYVFFALFEENFITLFIR